MIYGSEQQSDEFVVVSPIDLSTRNMNLDPLSPRVDIDNYYKAAWGRYNNCSRSDMMYHMNLMTDEAFYDTQGNAVPA